MANISMRRASVIRLGGVLLAAALWIATPALASSSHAEIWEALGNDVTCGVAIHAPHKAATEMLCSARSVPAPKSGSPEEGDPGFVFLGAHGQPRLARLSQDTFQGTEPVTLAGGRTWSELGVTCQISATTVRCANRSGHGFTIGKSSYKAF